MNMKNYEVTVKDGRKVLVKIYVEAADSLCAELGSYNYLSDDVTTKIVDGVYKVIVKIK